AFLLRFLIGALEDGNQSAFLLYFFLMLGSALLLVGLSIFYRFYYEYAYVEIENKLKNNLFRSILQKDYGQVKALHEEEWIHRLSSDTNIIASSILSILPAFCRMSVQLILALMAILYLFPIFGIALLPCVLLSILFTYFMRKRLKRLNLEMQEKEGKAKSFFSESLQGLSIIHSFVKQDVIAAKSEEKVEESKKARLKRNNFSILCSISYLIVYYLAYLLGLFFCGKAILEGNMSLALLTALIALLAQINGPLGNLTGIIPRYYALLASGERIQHEKEKAMEYASQKEIGEFYDSRFASLDIKDVSYSYLDKYGNRVNALEDFSLSIKKQERILIYGPSGSGKTTLFRLLLGLAKPEEGKILFNGEIPVSETYERLYSYVPQDNLLMQGTIEEAVTLYAKEVDEERFHKALELSDAEGFVNELPLKEKTYLNEKGSGLSLGQMERIAIARALYFDAPILLLDECCASLDPESEKKVLGNLLSLKEKTIVLISHHQYEDGLFDQTIALGE
ncbi:MAG: ABC transporter ATP-binding protein, partial [Bacilli bacterium]|nr:ABC transporter ATP-binding protein [Bacilli bacterium]